MNTDYDRDQEFPPPKNGVRTLILLVLGVLGFFVFEAIAVPQVRARGGSTDQMFFVILYGMVLAVVVPVILNFILKKLGLKGKKPHELVQMFVGYESPYAPLDQFSVPSDGREWRQIGAGAADRGLVPLEYSSDAAVYGNGDEDGDEVDGEFYVDEDDGIAELIEEDGLALAENFMPDPSSMTCQNIAFVGVRRMGKSNAEAILLRRLAEREFPLLILDSEDEYEELARSRYMPRGVLVGNEQMRPDVPRGIRFYAIDQASAYNFGQFVLQHHLQAVVNLKSWSDNAAAEIMSDLILGMEDWQQHRTRDDRFPFYVALTEITKWVPQNQGETTLSRDAVKMVQHALFDVAVRRGGKRGFGLIIDGQKYVEIDKRVLQGVWRVIFCQTEKSDLKFCEQQHGLEPDEVRALQPGESFVFCPQVPQGMYVRWPLCDVPLGGKSPGMENLNRHRQQISQSVTGVLTRLQYERQMQATAAAAGNARQQEEKQTVPPQDDERDDATNSKVTYLHPSQQPQPNSERQLVWGCAVLHYLSDTGEPFTSTAIRRPRKELRELALALGVIKTADAEEIIGGGSRAKGIKDEVENLAAPRMLALLHLATQAQATASAERERAGS